jgi:hypothetical protein
MKINGWNVEFGLKEHACKFHEHFQQQRRLEDFQ